MFGQIIHTRIPEAVKRQLQAHNGKKPEQLDGLPENSPKQSGINAAANLDRIQAVKLDNGIYNHDTAVITCRQSLVIDCSKLI